MVRNFEIGVEDADGLHRMTVSGFRNYDEALQYARQLHAQTSVARLIGNNRTYVISEPNLPLLGRQYSYTDYEKFYAKHFAPLKTSTEPLLTEPDFIAPAKPKNEDESQDDFDTPSADTPNNTNVLLEDTPADTNNTGNTVIIEDKVAPANAGNTETIIEDKPQQETGNQTVITDLEPEAKPSVKSEPKSEVIPEIKPEVKSEPKPAVKPEPKPEVKPEPKPKEKPSARKIEDEFYFGDAPAPSQPATKKAQPTAKDKQKVDDFDTDEYYDLEGF